jgi:hypothetical protein
MRAALLASLVCLLGPGLLPAQTIFEADNRGYGSTEENWAY